ncbi:MAG: CapA family protein [Lewinella sp.]|uniref:CapA family protein n=1 Tax=Lewinella sp. TaxID=2004506 RepID=UPI003D6B42A3
MGYDIFLCGDFYVGPYSGSRVPDILDSKIPQSVFGDLSTYIKNSKIGVLNLEAPVCSAGRKLPKTGPSLRMGKEVLPLLENAGFNLVTLANNHIMDYGEAGVTATINGLTKHNIRHVGADIQQSHIDKPFIETVGNYKLGIINICENEWINSPNSLASANGINEVNAYYQISTLRGIVDKTIVIYHGGNEYYPLPSPRIKRLFRYFVDCGADAVVAHHTHVASGFEVYKNSPVFYSLGNFVFDSTKKKSPDWYHGLAVGLNLKEDTIDFKILPFIQDFGNKNGLSLMEGNVYLDFMAKLHSYNDIIRDDMRLDDCFKEFARKKRLQYNSFLNPYMGRMVSLFKKGLLPNLLSASKKRLILNLCRCESHNDILKVTLMEQESTR